MLRQVSTRRATIFLILVPLLSIPFYCWSLLVRGQELPFGMPISALMVVVPAALATLMTTQEGGTRAVLSLWRGLFDLNRASPLWVVFGTLLMPLAMMLALAVAGAPLYPLASESLLLMLLLYLSGAAFEEIGWTGYATRPLQARLGVVGAGALIGTTWALWHVIPWGLGHPWSWVAGQCVLTVLMRLIMGVIYARGGPSLALATLLHASSNIAYSLSPGNGADYDPWLLSLVLALPAAILLWKRQ